MFGTEFLFPINRIGEVPDDENTPPLSESEKLLVMRVELPILDGHLLMGTDVLASMGHELKVGNNVTTNLEPDTREETDRHYDALSAGGQAGSGMHEMFWGSYWGSCLDRFGVRWMFNFPLASQ